ncbi:MAG: DNA-processing protein DprA [Chloroflexota bacterium]|nr:MAG: DNA-protecting protein DprA [Chloroflexota bacterium]
MPDPVWVALSLAEHVGGRRLRALLEHFDGDVQAILAAETSALARVPGIGRKTAANIQKLRPEQLEASLRRWQALGVRALSWDDPAYPEMLRRLEDAPPTLFVMGNHTPDASPALAIVGTRRPSPAAEAAARQLAALLAGRGYTIVSGLALGIDRAAHIGALSEPAGRTIAVLGSGVLNVYPPQHLALARAVAGRGALVCEVHPEATPNRASLVARNRLISGLSDGVIVIETEVGGGAMYAARFAREQGRAVYALDNDASGNRALLDAGATPISPDLASLPLG